jgi:hypothetical protein
MERRRGGHRAFTVGDVHHVRFYAHPRIVVEPDCGEQEGSMASRDPIETIERCAHDAWPAEEARPAPLA